MNNKWYLNLTKGEIVDIKHFDNQTLEIKLYNGCVYNYFNVPKWIANNLMESPRKESYFIDNIATHYACEKIK